MNMSQLTDTSAQTRGRWINAFYPLLFLSISTLSSSVHGAELSWDPNKILGSKHDLANLNKRAGVDAMEGLAFNKLENACIYCHIPEDDVAEESKSGQIQNWNRFRPISKNYEMYSSSTFESESGEPNDISLLCLSCHDGGMSVDRVVNAGNNWSSGEEQTLHMRISGDNDLESCGKCHDGSVAHNITIKKIGTNLTNDHPVSIRYAGLDLTISGFKGADGLDGFNNGVKLFDGFIECATCHDIHNPDASMLLRVDTESLCKTCHNN